MHGDPDDSLDVNAGRWPILSRERNAAPDGATPAARAGEPVADDAARLQVKLGVVGVHLDRQGFDVVSHVG